MSTFQAPRGASFARGRGRGRGRGGYHSSHASDEERRKNDIQRALNHEKRASRPARNGLTSKQFQPPPKMNGTSNIARGRTSKPVPVNDESRKFSKRSSATATAPTDYKWRDPTSGDSSIYAQRMHDLYQTLKKNRESERKDAIRRGVLSDPERPTSLKNAITPVGTCQDMCPEFERVERVVQNMIDGCEKTTSPSTGTKVPCEEYMVKRFRRSAAGYDEQLPSDIRPPRVLQKTLDYLIEKVVGGSKSLGRVHKFVWDRTRGIRNDFSIQQVTKVEDLRIAIDCFERIARFHILALHELSQPSEDNVGFEHHQEREQLNNTLLSLMYYYDDSRHKLTSPNEAEFRSYCIIFEIQDQRPDLEDRAQSWPKQLLKDPRIQTALKLYAAASNTINEQGPLRPRTTLPMAQAFHGRFFAIVQSNAVSYLLACTAEIYFNHIRGMALEAIWKAYRRGGNTKMEDLILGDLAIALGLDHEDEVQSICEEHGFTISEREDGQSYLDVRSVNGRWLKDSNPSRKQIFSQALVEKKRLGRSLLAVINGLSASKAREMDMLTESAQSSPDLKTNDDTLFLTDDDGSNHKHPSTAKKPDSITNHSPENPFLPKPTLTSMPQTMGIPAVPSFNFGQQMGTADKISPPSQASLSFGSSLSTNSRVTASTPPTFKFPSSTTMTSAPPNVSSGILTPKDAQMEALGIFKQPKATLVWSTTAFGQPTVATSSDNASQQGKTSLPSTAVFGQPSTTSTSHLTHQSEKLVFSFPSSNNSNEPTDKVVSRDSSFQGTPTPFAFFPSSSNGENKGTKPLDTKTSIFQQELPPVSKPFTFTPLSSTKDSKITASGLETSHPTTPAFKFAITPAASDSTTKNNSPNFFQSPLQNPFQPPGVANPSNPISDLTPQPLSQNTQQQNSASGPSIPQSKPIEPKHDPRPKRLDQLADTVFRQEDGILDQWIEFTIGPTILEEMEQITSEQRREDVAIARRIILSKKYARRWRKNAWNQRLRRQGRERRRNFAESLRREHELSQIAMQSTILSAGISDTPSGSPTRNYQTDRRDASARLDMLPPSQRTTSHLKQTSVGSELINQFPDGDVVPRKRHNKAEKMPGPSSLSPQITSKLKRKSLENEAADSFLERDAESYKKQKQAREVSDPVPLTNGYHNPHHRRSQTLGSSMNMSQSDHIFGPNSPYHSFRPVLPSEITLLDEDLMKKARRMLPHLRTGTNHNEHSRLKTDTTRTDYFRLKAMGIDPDTPMIPTTRKRRIPDEVATTVHKHPRLSPESSSDHVQIISSSSEVHPTTQGPATTPAARGTPTNEDKLEELFALARKAKEDMAKSETWFRETREKLERSRSATSSHRSHRGSHRTETEKEKKLREFCWTPSRTEVRLRATNGGGFLSEDYWKEHDAIRNGSQQTESTSPPSAPTKPIGFAAINNQNLPPQPPRPDHNEGFGAWRREQGGGIGHSDAGASVLSNGGGGAGASADDAIEL